MFRIFFLAPSGGTFSFLDSDLSAPWKLKICELCSKCMEKIRENQRDRKWLKMKFWLKNVKRSHRLISTWFRAKSFSTKPRARIILTKPLLPIARRNSLNRERIRGYNEEPTILIPFRGIVRSDPHFQPSLIARVRWESLAGARDGLGWSAGATRIDIKMRDFSASRRN